MERWEIQKQYERWLLGKHIDGVSIKRVWWEGNKVYGIVKVELENGKRMLLSPFDSNAFRLRKKDLRYYVDEYKGGIK